MYVCPKCKERTELEYTELYSWCSAKPKITKGEVKCPKCNRRFWVKHKEIKKKYPKTWGKFIQFIYSREWDNILENKYLKINKTSEFESYVESLSFESLSGWLFKFFDDQGIYIAIECISFGGRIWETRITSSHGLLYKSEILLKSRQEAKQIAFTKAFEILENK